LREEGLSVSAIARRAGMDRKTVRKYLKAGLKAPSYGPRAPLLDPYRSYKDYYWPSLFKIYEHIAKRVLDQGFRVGDPYEDHMDKDHFATVPHMSPPSRGDVVPTHSVSKPTESISIPVVMEM